MLDSSGNELLDDWGSPIKYGWTSQQTGGGSDTIVSPISTPPITPPASGTSAATKATGTTSASPWSSIGSTFTDIFGNLAKNVLPGAVTKYTGIALPGAVPGSAGSLPKPAAAGVSVSKTAGIGVGALLAVAVGAYFLLGRKR